MIIDDGRLSPETQQSLAEMACQAGVAWRYLPKTCPGLTRSRNLALARADTEIVQFLDDDAEPTYCFLREILSLFACDAGGDMAVLGGNLEEPALTGLGGRTWLLASRMAGWWGIGRRWMRRGPWPAAAGVPCRVVPTPNVTGAALAVRRVAVYPPGFDESLTGYALGEDRELSYRLARTHLVGRATRARVVHHHDPAGRVDPAALGHATVYNYCYILSKNGPMGVGEWLAVLWSLLVIGALRLGSGLAGNRRRHLSELVGMIRGGAHWIHHCLSQNGSCW